MHIDNRMFQEIVDYLRHNDMPSSVRVWKEPSRYGWEPFELPYSVTESNMYLGDDGIYYSEHDNEPDTDVRWIDGYRLEDMHDSEVMSVGYVRRLVESGFQCETVASFILGCVVVMWENDRNSEFYDVEPYSSHWATVQREIDINGE